MNIVVIIMVAFTFWSVGFAFGKEISENDPDDLIGYSFDDENNQTITVLAVIDEWCVVENEWGGKPFLLEKEFVLAIKNAD